MSLSHEKVLITGGAGYVGSALTLLLLDQGFHVTVLDNFIYNQSSLMQCCSYKNFEVVRADCRDEILMAELVKDKDIIIPMAALVGAPTCKKNKIAAETTNLGAIRLLFKLLSKSQLVLYPATDSSYGVGEKGKYCTESSTLHPLSYYSITKAEAEEILLSREDTISLRLATGFGVSPRMRMDLLINNFVYRAITDRAIVIFEGHFKRNHIHVQDMAKAFLHGIENRDMMKGKSYNVGLEEANLSKIELCEFIQRFIPQFTFLEAPIGEDPDKRNYCVSIEKILSTGFRTDWTLEDGIRELIKCYTILQHPRYSNT